MLLLNYGIDLGALGYRHAGTAILKLNDTTKNLRLFTLPNTFDQIKWFDNKIVSAKFDTIPFVRIGKSSTYEDTIVNGVKVKVSSYDYIEPNTKQVIEHREKSPNGQFELVAYRYIKNEQNLNFIHISVISTGGQIPKYGNYLIADMHSDYVLNGTWDKDNMLIFYSNNRYADEVQYFLVQSRPNINYRLITDNKTYGGKYRWIEQSGR